MGEAYLYDAVRTPRGRGKSSGSLYPVKPVTLLSTALEALQARNDLDTSKVDDVIIGCVTQVGDQGACIARTSVLQAGWSESTPGVTLNRFCGSGLEAVHHGAALIKAGFNDLVVSGGVESMSRVKMGSDGGAMTDIDFQFKVGFIPQGISADLVATMAGISRADVDAFAAASQARCAAAVERGAFDRSIIPVNDFAGNPILIADEHPRPGTTQADLAKLRPAFEAMGVQFKLDALARRRYPHVEHVDHIHHAGNSSGIVDGAAAILLGDKASGEALGLKPRARIVTSIAVGDEPVLMLEGPIPASKRALAKAGMTVDDIDLWEINEAFAAVVLRFTDVLGLDHSSVNVNGGAIAMGHPLGATGAMILGTLLDEMERQDLSTGLAALCVGAGMGTATIIERV